MNWFVKWGVKKYAVSALNGVIENYKDNVQAALGGVDKAIAKAEAVMAFLKSLREKLADNKITEDEADAIVDEGTALVNEVMA